MVAPPSSPATVIESVTTMSESESYVYDDDLPSPPMNQCDMFYQLCVENRQTEAMILCLANPDLDVNFEYDCCFKVLCSNGHLDFACWIYETFGVPMLDEPVYVENLIESVSAHGHAHIMEWFHHIGIIDSTVSLVSAYYRAALGEHDEITNWIMNTYPDLNEPWENNEQNDLINSMYYEDCAAIDNNW